MVFDWFQRGATPPPAAPNPAEAPEAAEAAEAAEATEPPSAPAPAEPATPPVGSVDEDALAWAREAYARLRAQQEAARRAPETPAPETPAPELPDIAVAAPETAPAAGLSLLEQAAAERRARRCPISGANPQPLRRPAHAPARFPLQRPRLQADY